MTHIQLSALCVSALLLLSCSSGADSPYTVSKVDRGIYRIEDSNAKNPAGETFDAEGNKTHFNNCSDMYLLKGSDSALLIDLSNDIKWADDADKYLRDIVHKLSGGKPLTITFTHNHGDHTGMLHAFIDDADVRFALPRTDFGKSADRVPADRSYLYAERHTFSLGGMEVESLKVAGHTPGSVVFFVKDKNLVFTGDAIGSGHGVWIFNKAGFEDYVQGFTAFLTYLDENNIDKDNLRVFGGHYWQRDWLPELGDKEMGFQYISDMQELIGRICRGEADSEPSGLDMKAVDTYYRYGSAIVASNPSIISK